MPLDESKRPVYLPLEGERVLRSFTPEIRFGRVGAESETADRTVVTINTPQEDRHGTVIEAAGIDLEAYKSNPVVLAMHDPYLPLANGSAVKRSGNNLVATLDDSAWDLDNPQVREWHRRVKRGIVRMASLSVTVRSTEKELRDPAGDPYDWRNIRVRITESELREWSFVTIGSNRGALVTERMSSGLIVPAEKPLVFPLSLETGREDSIPSEPDPAETPAPDVPEATPPAQTDRLEPAEPEEQPEPARPTARRDSISRAEALALLEEFGETIRTETKRKLGRA